MSNPSSRIRVVRRVTDEEVLKAAAEAVNMRALLCALGIASYGGNYDSMRRRLGRLGALSERFLPLRDRPAGHFASPPPTMSCMPRSLPREPKRMCSERWGTTPTRRCTSV